MGGRPIQPVEVDWRVPQLSTLVFDDIQLAIASEGKGYSVSFGGWSYRVESIGFSEGEMELLIDGRRVLAYVSQDGPRRWVTIGGRTYTFNKTSASRRSAAGHDASSELSAPMPGQVRTVEVKAGDVVTKGQVLMVLEAMKMEIRLQAPYDGKISSVDASVGQTVEREQILIRMERE